MANYIYTLLDKNNEPFMAITGSNNGCVKSFMERSGWTGVSCSSGNATAIKANKNQRVGFVYGRDRSLPVGKQYVKLAYIRTLNPNK